MDTTYYGTVYKKTQGYSYVRSGERTVRCAVSNRLRKSLVYPIAAPSSLRPVVVAVRDIEQVDPIAVGDQVSWVDAGDGTGLINEVLPRRSALSRRAAGRKPLEQVIVANLDQVVAVFSAAQPAPKWHLLDRYLVSAEAAGLPAVICITKIDLVMVEELAPVAEIYRRIGYPVYLTSILSGAGIGSIAQALKGRTSALLGKSGVGKTSLLNAIQPDLGLRVNAVSQTTNKGKHTTTSLEMFDLEMGGSLIDTPGIREFGLWEVDGTELGELFPEMRSHLGRCRYGASCRHESEPGCVIKQAVENGQIAEERYESYLSMRD